MVSFQWHFTVRYFKKLVASQNSGEVHFKCFKTSNDTDTENLNCLTKHYEHLIKVIRDCFQHPLQCIVT